MGLLFFKFDLFYSQSQEKKSTSNSDDTYNVFDFVLGLEFFIGGSVPVELTCCHVFSVMLFHGIIQNSETTWPNKKDNKPKYEFFIVDFHDLFI